MATATRSSASRGHYIGGSMVPGQSTETIDVFDPATGERIDEVAAAGKADVDAAVGAARHCFDAREWRNRTPADRAYAIWTLSERIMEHVDEFAELEVRDNCMPMMFARGVIGSPVDGLGYYAGMVTKLHGITADVSGNGR